MIGREREYRWYLTGCERLDQTPISKEEFEARWQEFEDHAEMLKAAEAGGCPPDIEVSLRIDMRRRIQDDPFVKAVLVGMAEDPSA